MNYIIKLLLIVVLLASGARMVFADGVEFTVGGSPNYTLTATSTIPTTGGTDYYTHYYSSSGGTASGCLTLGSDQGTSSGLNPFVINLSSYTAFSPVVFNFYTNGSDMANAVNCLGSLIMTWNGSSWSGQYSSADTLNYTRIISTTPLDNTTVSTTTTLIITGNINPDDLASTTQVTTYYSNAGCSGLAVAPIQAVDGTCNFSVTYNATSSGYFSYSTTTTFGFGGTWDYKASIQNVSGSYCVFGFCLFEDENILTQKQGSFIVGQYNGLDIIFNISTSTAYTADFSVCNPISGFDTLGCLQVLLIPNQAQINQVIDNLKTGFLTRAPWGYVTRFISLMNGTTATSTPVLSIYFPTGEGLPDGIQGQTFSLDPFSAFSSTSPLTTSEDYDGNSFMDIFMPWWNIIIGFLVIVAVVHDIFGMSSQSGHSKNSDFVTVHKGNRTYLHKKP